MNFIIHTPVFELNDPNDGGYIMINDHSNTLIFGSENTEYTHIFGDIIDLDCHTFDLTALSNINVDTPILEINEQEDGAYLKLDNYNKHIIIGSNNTLETDIYGLHINIKNAMNFIIHTPVFELNDPNDGGYIMINDHSNSLIFGSENTEYTHIFGDIVNIDANTQIDMNASIFEVNEVNNGGYLKVDDINNTITIGSSNTLQTFLYGVNFNFNGNSYIINTPLFQINDDSDGAYFKLDNSNNTITLGSDYTLNTDIYGNIVNINTDIKLDFNTPIFQLNDNDDGGYFKFDNINNIITIGSSNTDKTIIYGDIIDLNATDINLNGANINIEFGCNYNIDVDYFSINKNRDGARFIIDDINSLMEIGGINLETNRIYGNNIIIGKYDNYFRINEIGDIGIGLDIDSNILAKVHINYSDSNLHDIFRIDDKDHDDTPFIITNTGRVGFGTTKPEYKIDIWNDEGLGEGVAIRDALYLKTNHVNRIFFSIGGVGYSHTNTSTQAEIGFYFSWDENNTIFTDYDAECYTFRLSIKFHASMVGKNVAYYSFEKIILPTDNGNYYPTSILDTGEHQSKTKKFKKISCISERVSSNKVLVKVYWTYKKHGDCHSDSSSSSGSGKSSDTNDP